MSYPLVNVYITNWKITMFNGKSTIKSISMAIFNSELLVITRGYVALICPQKMAKSGGSSSLSRAGKYGVYQIKYIATHSVYNNI